MVLGHTTSPFVNFIYLFHVALFFIISGYLFADRTYLSLSSLFKHLLNIAKRLWLPFVIFVSALILLHNCFVDINFLTNNELFLQGSNGNSWGLKNYYSLEQVFSKLLKAFSFSNSEQLAGALWFLKALFLVSVFSALIRYTKNLLFKSDNKFYVYEAIVYSVILLLAYWGYINQSSCCRIFSTLFLFYIGILISRYFKNLILNMRLFLFSFIMLLIFCYFNVKVDVGTSEHSSFLLFLLASIFGFIFVLNLSFLFSKREFVKNIFSYIGQNTLVILCFHFIAFKFVTLFQIYYYDLPMYRLASFPTYDNGYYWIVYFMAGVVIPLLLSAFWYKLKFYLISFFSGKIKT